MCPIMRLTALAETNIGARAAFIGLYRQSQLYGAAGDASGKPGSPTRLLSAVPGGGSDWLAPAPNATAYKIPRSIQHDCRSTSSARVENSSATDGGSQFCAGAARMV